MPVRAIDIHAHVLLPGILGACGKAGPELTLTGDIQTFRAGRYSISGVKFLDSPMSSPDQRLALMDRMGISFQVLSPYPMLFFYDQPDAVGISYARRHNEEMAALIRQHLDRFGGFATLPMQSPAAAAAELRRAVQDLGLYGSYLGSSFCGRPISDPAFDIVWQEHARLGVPVVIHPAPAEAGPKAPWDLDLVIGFSNDETSAIAHLILGGVLDRHPGLVAIIPHGGGFAPYVRSRIEMAIEKRPWGRGLLKRPFAELWDQLYFDSLIHDVPTLDYLIKVHGAERLLLGTNFAAWDQDDHMIERISALDIPATAKTAILSGNAERLFPAARV